MKKITGIIVITAIVVVSAVSEAQDVPSSERSRQAIARVKPKLLNDFSAKGFKWGSPIFIRIFKKEKELELWLKDNHNFRLLKTYRVCSYGWRGLGPKIRQGDGKAPEGFYFVTANGLNPLSEYHLSFNLGYPNAYDRAHARTGSALMVHGKCVSIGCYAMTDPIIEQIYALSDAALKNGQRFFRVHIFPFRMTNANMKKHTRSKWLHFWKNLKEGYDFFESNGHNPPNVEVKNKRYVFEPS